MDRPLRAREPQPAEEAARRLARIDGRGYKAYREIEGAWRLQPGVVLCIDRVQADPYAPPSAARLQVDLDRSGLPAGLCRGSAGTVAFCDFLARKAAAAASGGLVVHGPGAEVLARSTVCVEPDEPGLLELRLGVALPASGRRIRGREAERLLLDRAARLAAATLTDRGVEAAALRAHVEAVEDQRALRAQLEERGLVAFVAEGAVLPRASGVSQEPLDPRRAVPFTSPESLRVRLRAPHAGEVEGMGLPAGVTLLCGGGFHGKSTLLEALARCVYDHPPGDGRELCVTRADAVKLRAEQGRWVGGVDISAFLGPLPGGGRTEAFTTANASGSTSQAASLVLALIHI